MNGPFRMAATGWPTQTWLSFRGESASALRRLGCYALGGSLRPGRGLAARAPTRSRDTVPQPRRRSRTRRTNPAAAQDVRLGIEQLHARVPPKLPAFVSRLAVRVQYRLARPRCAYAFDRATFGVAEHTRAGAAAGTRASRCTRAARSSR